MKKSNFIIPLVVYPYNVMVSLGQTNFEIENSIRRNHFTTNEACIDSVVFKEDTTHGISAQFDLNNFVLRVRYYPETPNDYGCLQHEVFHIVNFLMDDIGVMYETGKSDEAYAYLIAYLTEQIYTRIK